MARTRNFALLAGVTALVTTAVVAATTHVGADPSSGPQPVFVPISPCRIADTRPAPNNVGAREGAIGAGETITVVAHGTNGDCTLPTSAVGLSLNITALGATQQSFLTVWPGGERPNAASLNPAPGQPPVPNAVAVALSDAGSFDLFNNAGSVHTVIDVNGYYEDHDHDARYATRAEVDAAIADIDTSGPPTTGGETVDAYTTAEADALFTTHAEVDQILADTTYSEVEIDTLFYRRTGADERFYEGDRVLLVAGDGTAAENGAALKAALASITDASPTNPAFVRLGAGTFDVGPDGVAMVPSVSIGGAGAGTTIITSVGLGGSYVEVGTVTTATDTTLSDVTVRNTGGDGTTAIGVLGMGVGWTLRSSRVEIVANDASTASGINGGQVSGSPGFTGLVDDVEVHVAPGSADASFTAGIGHPIVSTGDHVSLLVRDSSIVLDSRGTGLDEFGVDPIDSVYVARDTSIRLNAGGTGMSMTWPDLVIMDAIDMLVDGGSSNNRGFSGAGSGFRPQISNSRIDVRGTGAAAIDASSGFVTVRNSIIDSSSIGVRKVTSSTSPFSGTVHVDGSVVDAPTVAYTESGTNPQRLRFTNSELDGSTLVNAAVNDVDAICFGSFDDDYQLIADDCSGPASGPLGGRTVLVPGSGTDSENGDALVAAVAEVATAFPAPANGDEWVIRMEPGHFLLTSTITLPGHVRLEGAGIEETFVECACPIFGATAPVTIAEMELESSDTGYMLDFDDDVRLERLRIVNTDAGGETLRLDGGDAVLVDVDLVTNATALNNTLLSTVDSIELTGVDFIGNWGRWRHLGGDVTVRDSRLHALYVPSGTASILIEHSTIDTGTSTPSPIYTENAAIVDLDIRHVDITTTVIEAIRTGTDDALHISHSTVQANTTTTNEAIDGGGPVDIEFTAVSESVSGTPTATCLATIDLDNGSFLADTCP